MNQLNQLLAQLEKLTANELDQLIAAATSHRAKLKTKGILILTLVNGEYILRLNATSKGIKLGAPISPAAAIRQAAAPSPSPSDFEISKEEAKTRMNKQPETVGWWDGDKPTGTAGRRYYLVEPYHQARATWHEQHKLTSDPLALAYHLSSAAVKRVRELESEGYTIQLPE